MQMKKRIYQPVDIRWMIRRDMDEVLEIEKQSFDDPWQKKDFIERLRVPNNIGMVFTYQEVVAGYVVYTLHKRSLEILNLAVHPEYRRCSAGTLLIERLQYKVNGHFRRDHITALVRETNLPAQMLLSKNHFICDGIIKGAYRAHDEDAYSFTYRGLIL
ncbi:GNAT family N-acetyltransferase [Pirellulaceae bacterium SH449]